MTEPLDKLRKAKAAQAGASRRAAPPQKSEAGSVHETQKGKFSNILYGFTEEAAEKKLEKILDDIKKLSQLLVRRRLLEDLADYRSKVSEFLRTYMDEALELRDASGRRGFSKRKQMLVVKKVNVELEELSRLVLGGAEDFKIMKELGTIEGLLMDLYR